jgi:general stress protein YciG
MADKEKGAMTVREAGHKGGEKTKERYGEGFYEEIGRKGGKIGGETTKERYGGSFYEDIGHKGGQKVKELIERGKTLRGEK